MELPPFEFNTSHFQKKVIIDSKIESLKSPKVSSLHAGGRFIDEIKDFTDKELLMICIEDQEKKHIELEGLLEKYSMEMNFYKHLSGINAGLVEDMKERQFDSMAESFQEKQHWLKLNQLLASDNESLRTKVKDLEEALESAAPPKKIKRSLTYNNPESILDVLKRK